MSHFFSLASGQKVGNLTLANGSITDSGSAISLSTNTLECGVLTAATGSAIGNVTIANGSITDSNGAISFGNVNLSTTGTLGCGILTAATGSSIGNLLLASGSITDSSGTISFGDETLSTTGTLGCGALTTTGGLDIKNNESTGASINLYEGNNGTNKITIQAPNSLSQDFVFDLPASGSGSTLVIGGADTTFSGNNIFSGSNDFTGIPTFSQKILYGIQIENTFGHTSGNALTITSSVVILNHNTSGGTHVFAIGDGTNGQMVHFFFSTDASDQLIKLDFGEDTLLAGSGESQFLTFNTSGQSATIFFTAAFSSNSVDTAKAWRIINTGGAVS